MTENNDSKSDNSIETGRNEFKLRAYDLEVSAESEDASLDQVAEVCAKRMDEMMTQALIGEYQELEERDLHGLVFE